LRSLARIVTLSYRLRFVSLRPNGRSNRVQGWQRSVRTVVIRETSVQSSPGHCFCRPRVSSSQSPGPGQCGGTVGTCRVTSHTRILQ
jgi:hypothetical protein